MSMHTEKCELGPIAVLCALMYLTLSTPKLFPFHDCVSARICQEQVGKKCGQALDVI